MTNEKPRTNHKKIVQVVFTDDSARQPQETDKSWQAFSKLLMLPAGTSLKKLTKYLGKTGSYTSWLSEWSVKYNWQARRSRYFNEEIEKQQEMFSLMQIERREEFLRKEWEKIDKLEQYIDKALELVIGQPPIKQTTKKYERDEKTKLVNKVSTIIVEPHALMKEIRATLKQWRDVARVAYGLPLDNQLLPDNEGHGSGGQLAAIEEALAKVGKTEDYSEFEQFNQPKSLN